MVTFSKLYAVKIFNVVSFNRELRKEGTIKGSIKTAKQDLLKFLTNAIGEAKRNGSLKVKSIADLRTLANIIKVLEKENVAIDPIRELVEEIQKIEKEGKNGKQ